MSSLNRNAIILAAGTSSRFVPLSFEFPKALLPVKGEILIERQIRQLKEANIRDITIVTGYMKDKFQYLGDKFDISLVYNEDYYKYNNTSSLIRVCGKLKNTLVCSADNYFSKNVFLEDSNSSFYSSIYIPGVTNEYCIEFDKNENIVNVRIGGCSSWVMIGPVFFADEFSRAFVEVLKKEYEKEHNRICYWEDIYIKNINELPPLKIKKFEKGIIEEFDSLDELRKFDDSYKVDSKSSIIKEISKRLKCEEKDLYGFENLPHSGNFLLFQFLKDGKVFIFDQENDRIISQ